MKKAKHNEVPKEYRKDYKKIFLEELQMLVIVILLDIFMFLILFG